MKKLLVLFLVFPVLLSNVLTQEKIAVLPFQNMNGDPEKEFFAYGIAEDIITALSRFHGLMVIASNSSFCYRGESIDVRQVGRELDVQYVLEGSVRTANNHVRITTQLIETCIGKHVWAERFERLLEDVFEVQDEITTLVASIVSRQVDIAEFRSALHTSDRDLDYRGLFHRGMSHLYKTTAKDCAKAREYAQQAIDRYPELVGGYSLMAYVNMVEFIWGFGVQTRAQLIPDAAEYANSAIRVDPDDELARTILGDIYGMLGNHDEGIEECETVLRLNPNFAYAYGILGQIHAFSGKAHYQQAVHFLDHAIRLSPNDPQLQFYFANRGLAEFFNNNYAAAIDWLHRSLKRNPDLASANRVLTTALALNGEPDQARSALNNVLRIEPNCTISDLRHRYRQMFRHQHDFDTYVHGLQRAGLPEV